MSGNGEQLPAGWAEAPLSEIATILMGQSPPSSTYNSDGRGLPFFQGKKEFGVLYPAAKVWCSKPGKIAEEGDILLSIRAPVGPTNLAPTRCCIGRGLSAIRPEADLDKRYLLYAFRCFAAELETKGTGTTFKAVSGKVVGEFSFPIPPSAEQSRIADALDELFSDLDAGIAALERIRERLELYRTSILKAAVEGMLTAEWREQHAHIEPASAFLKQILAERRQRWEEDQHAMFNAKKQEPPRNWRSIYKEPASPDTTGLPHLAEEWCWATLDQIADISGGVTKGQRFSEGAITREVPYLRVANVQRGYLDLAEIKTIQALESDIKDLCLQPGDVLFTEGGDRDKLGRGWIWNGEIEECIHQNHVFRARLYLHEVNSKLISWFGNSYGQQWFRKKGKQSVNLASINMTVLKTFPVALAPRCEQEIIVKIIEDQFSILDRLEADLGNKLISAQALRQSILHRAFSGHLLPQSPSDEPASELLKRIALKRAERTSTPVNDKNWKKRTKDNGGARRGLPRKNLKGNN